MSDSKKAYEDKFYFWEEQNIEPVKRSVYINPRIACGIIDRALIEVKDADLGEDLEAVKDWITKNQQ